MTWVWVIASGGATFLALSILVGLAIGAVLRNISLEVSEVFERESWAFVPPTRATASEEASTGRVRDREPLLAESRASAR
jgi:hypothetical protein